MFDSAGARLSALSAAMQPLLKLSYPTGTVSGADTVGMYNGVTFAGSTPDTTPPYFTVFPALIVAGANSAQYQMQASEYVTVYVMVVEFGSTAPSIDQIIAGVNYGTTIVSSTTQVNMPGLVTTQIYSNGLASSTTYIAYFALVDAAGNKIATRESVVITTSAGTVTPPGTLPSIVKSRIDTNLIYSPLFDLP